MFIYEVSQKFRQINPSLPYSYESCSLT